MRAIAWVAWVDEWGGHKRYCTVVTDWAVERDAADQAAAALGEPSPVGETFQAVLDRGWRIVDAKASSRNATDVVILER